MERLIRILGALGVLVVVTSPVQAQVQRSFVNLGFESPDWGSTSCFVQVPSSLIPGWQTTHPSANSNGGCTNAPSPVVNGPLIEIWANGGPTSPPVAPAEGTQFAELNAQQNSRIYQNVCMMTGEQVSWSFLHRGRSSATVHDVAEFNIDNNGNTVVTARTTSNGSTGYTAADCTGNEGGVTSGTCSSPALVGTWRRYSGTFTWNGASGTHNVGFAAISTGGGLIGAGNFIDDIRFTLRPFVEFGASTFTIPEQGPATGVVQVRAVGVVPAGGMTILVQATGGTATSGADYTVGNVVVPAGDYSTGQLFDVPITVADDAIIEDNETIQLALTASPQDYTLASTTVCGSTAITSTTVIIVDNDADLLTTKTASTATPVAGEPFTYTVTFQNNTARPTVAPLTAHDVTAAIADAVPAGIAFQNWTCAASGGAACPAASGTGAIGGNVSLPAGVGAAGGMLTYTITAVANGAPNCGSIANISTIAAPAGFQEGTSAQPGFTTPAPGGTANNTASADVDPLCRPALTLHKVTTGEAGGPFGFTLTNTLQASGMATTAAADTPVQVDGDTGTAGTQPFVVMEVDTAITIDESGLPTGWTLADAACTISGNAVGSLSGTSYTIPGGSVVENAAIICTFTNALQPRVTIRKTSLGGTDSFGFSGSNGIANQTLTTITAGTPVSGVEQALTAAGTATTITESTMPATYRVTDIDCTGLPPGGTATPDLPNRTVVLNAAATATGADIVCTFTNTLQQTDIQVTKTASPVSVVSGDVVAYQIVVSNNGPLDVDNVVLTDVASAGQDCTTPSTTATCSASGGASCPSPTVPVSSLLGSGVTIPTLPVGGQAAFGLQCQVTASGL